MKLSCALLALCAASAPPRISLTLDESAILTKLAPGIAREHDLSKVNPNGKKVGSQQDWTQRCPAGSSNKKNCPFPKARAVDHQDANVKVVTRIFLVDADGKTSNTEVPKVNFAKRSTYLFKYDATDSAGNHAEQVVFALILDDTTAPVIDLCGKSHEIVQAASAWTLCGSTTASDNVDGAIKTFSYTVKQGKNILAREVPLAIARKYVNSRKMGTFAVTVTAHDKAGIYGKGAQDNVVSASKMVVVRDTLKPVFRVYGADPAIIQCGATYKDAGASAVDKLNGALPVTTRGIKKVNTKKVNDYTVTYSAKDAAGNKQSAKRNVQVRDTRKPTIALLGNGYMELTAGTKFVDPGFTASDTCSEVKKSTKGKVSSTKVGTYTITYTATDGSGNSAKVYRKVAVVDKSTPVLTLVGLEKITTQASVKREWTDPGAACQDGSDGNLNNMVEVTGNTVNLRVAGVYTLKYNCMDISGNKALPLTRVVTVVDTSCPKIKMLGKKQVTVEAGYPYKDAGATARDTLDGNLTPAIWSDGAAIQLYKSFKSAQSCHEIKRSYPTATSGAYLISAYANNKFIQLEAWCDMHTVAKKIGKVGFTYVKAPKAIQSSYKLHKGKHCGGKKGGRWGISIRKWADGTSANYGAKKMKTRAQCKTECDKHSECAGFVHRDSDNNCNFWKGGALAPFKLNGHHCYEKKAVAQDGCSQIGLSKAKFITASAATKFGKTTVCSPNDEKYNLAHKRVIADIHSHPGKYLVTYHVSDRDGNKECKAPRRTVTVVDTLPPVISLTLKNNLIHKSASGLMEEAQTAVNGWIIGAVASAVAGVAMLASGRSSPTSVPV